MADVISSDQAAASGAGDQAVASGAGDQAVASGAGDQAVASGAGDQAVASGAGDVGGAPPYRKGPSLRPAMIPLAIGAVVVFGGIALSLVADGPPPPLITSNHASRLPGVSLAAVPALKALSMIATSGEPPTNVENALVLPDGSSVTSHEDTDGDLSQFDRSVTLSTTASPAQVLSFYRAEMAHLGWSRLGAGSYAGSGGESTQLFFQIAGDDSYEWQVAITVTPVSPSITPALGGGGQTAPTTQFEITLVQAEDGD